MKRNFDFYVGTPSQSSEAGAWHIATITLDHGADGWVEHELLQAEAQLITELKAQGVDFLFVKSAGWNDVPEEEEDE